MRVGDLLQRLDSRVLPPLASGLAWLGHGPVRARGLTGVAVMSATVLLVTAVWAADRAPLGDPPSAEVIRVGVGAGQSVPDYLSDSRGELAALIDAAANRPPVDTYAVVSFAAYFAPERLTGVLQSVTVTAVYAHAHVTGLRTGVERLPAVRVPQDVITGMLALARGRDGERARYRRLARSLTGSSPAERRLRLAYEDAARVAAIEATAYRAGCSCIFAAVVRGTPAALGRLVRRPEVRVVDPAPEVRTLDGVEFRPLLPDRPVGGVPESGAPSDVTTRVVAARPAVRSSRSAVRSGRLSVRSGRLVGAASGGR